MLISTFEKERQVADLILLILLFISYTIIRVLFASMLEPYIFSTVASVIISSSFCKVVQNSQSLGEESIKENKKEIKDQSIEQNSIDHINYYAKEPQNADVSHEENSPNISNLIPLAEYLKETQMKKNVNQQRISFGRSLLSENSNINTNTLNIPYTKPLNQQMSEQLSDENTIDFTQSQETMFSATILNNIKAGIVLIDSNFSILFCNNQVKASFEGIQEESQLCEQILKLEVKQTKRKKEASCTQKIEEQRKGGVKYNKQMDKSSQHYQHASLSNSLSNSLVQLREQQNGVSRVILSSGKQSKTQFTSEEQEESKQSEKQKTINEEQNKKGISLQKPKKQLKSKKSSSQQLLDTNYHDKSNVLKSPQKLNYNQVEKSNSIQKRRETINKNINPLDLPQRLQQKPIPYSITSVFKKEALSLCDIIREIFKIYERQFKQNHWSTSDLPDRLSSFLKEDRNVESQVNHNEQIIYLMDENSLVIHFKNKKIFKNFVGIRIGLFTGYLKEITNINQPKDYNKYIMIEFFDKSKLSLTINEKEIYEYKNRMLASVSHELRTPLNCSIQMLDILRNKFEDQMQLSAKLEVQEDLKDSLVIPALNSNLLLLHIINDIVDFGQINTGKFNLIFTYFSIFDLVYECIELIKYQAALKGLVIEVFFDTNLPEQIHSDQNRIRQVLLNLLSNSLKYTAKGQISVRVTQESNELIKIDVVDTGCGISENHLSNIFDTYGKRDTSKYLNTSGAGLGLSITNNLACGLGGNRRIIAKSKPNEGSSFTFFIVNRGVKQQGCQYKLKDIFNQQLIKWETFNKMDTIGSPRTATHSTSANKLTTESMFKSIFRQQQSQFIQQQMLSEIANGRCDTNMSSQQIAQNLISQSTHSPTLHKTNDVQENTQKNTFTDYYQNSSTTSFIKYDRQNTLTITIKPKSMGCGEKSNTKIISDKSLHHISQTITQNSLQFDNKNLKSFPLQYKVISSIIDSEIISDLQSLSKESPKIRFRSTERSEEVPSHIHHDLIEEENSKIYQNVNISNFHQAKQYNFSEFNKPICEQIKLISEFSNPESSVGGTNSFLEEEKRVNQSTFLSEKSQPHPHQKIPLLSSVKKSTLKQQRSGLNLPKLETQQIKKGRIEHQVIKQKLNQQRIQQYNKQKECQCSQILIVDDNDFNLYALQVCLKSYGFEVEKAISGMVALEIVQQKLKNSCCKKPTLIFMDIDMPIMDGHTTTIKILQFYKGQNINPPIISACSAYVQECEKKKAIQSGMSFYMTKPIKMEELENILLNSFFQKE